MTGSVLWGVLAITLLSLVSVAPLFLMGYTQRLPYRLRLAVEATFNALLTALLVWSLYRSLFSEDGLVAQGQVSDDVARLGWALLSVVMAALTTFRVVKAISSGNRPGTGASE